MRYTGVGFTMKHDVKGSRVALTSLRGVSLVELAAVFGITAILVGIVARAILG